MTMENGDRAILVQHRIAKAREAISQVEFLLENQMLAVAVNRIYYGMFFAVSALALKHKFTTSKHGQLIGWFNKNFVKEGRVERRIGHLIRAAFDSRSAGDYDDWIEFSYEEVAALLEGMKEFILEMERLIQEQ